MKIDDAHLPPVVKLRALQSHIAPPHEDEQSKVGATVFHLLIILRQNKLSEEGEFDVRLAIRERWTANQSLESKFKTAWFERAELGPPKCRTGLAGLLLLLPDTFRSHYHRPTQNIWNLVLGGRHDFGMSSVTALVALGQGRITGPFITSQFNGSAASTDANGNNLQDGVGYAYSNKDIFIPKLTPVVTPGNVSIYDPRQYSLNNIGFSPGHTFQRNAEGQAD